jgi:biopolymer transport protein ExbB/TolQ
MDTLFVNLVTLQASAPTAHANKLDPWQLVMQASPTVKLVMVLLLLMSLTCWFIIGAKLFRLERATRQSNRFLDLFWESGRGQAWTAERLESVYGQLSSLNTSPLAKVFHAGYVELARVLGAAGARGAGSGEIDNVERALRRASINEITILEAMTPFLATTGSTAPFVGLFGTVWGIYHALTAIGIAGQASIDKVAGPVGEALIMTAIGLAVAVPAVLGYNWLVRRNKAALDEVRAFGSDLHSVLLSQAAAH